MNLHIMQWFDPLIILFMVMSLGLNGLVAYLWHKKFYQKLGLKTYQAIQRIHLNETPRLAGLIRNLFLYSSPFFYSFYAMAYFMESYLTFKKNKNKNS